MTAIWASREAVSISCLRFCARKVWNRWCSERASSSFGSSALSCAVEETQVTAKKPPAMTHAATAAMSIGSLTLPPRARKRSPTPLKGDPARLRFWPGRRLMVIIGRRFPWSGSRRGAERQADREHQERRDLVPVHGLEDAVGDFEALDRVRLLAGEPEPVRQHLVEPRDPGPAAGGEQPRHPAGGPAGRLEERGRALDAHRELLAAALQERQQQRVGLEGLEQALALLGRDAALALQVLAEAAGADRDVAGEDGDAVVEDVHVRGLVGDIDQAGDPAHGLRAGDLAGVVPRGG